MVWKTITEVRPYGITAEGTHFLTSGYYILLFLIT